MENEIKQITTIISSLPDGMMLSIIPENKEGIREVHNGQH